MLAQHTKGSWTVWQSSKTQRKVETKMKEEVSLQWNPDSIVLRCLPLRMWRQVVACQIPYFFGMFLTWNLGSSRASNSQPNHETLPKTSTLFPLLPLLHVSCFPTTLVAIQAQFVRILFHFDEASYKSFDSFDNILTSYISKAPKGNKSPSKHRVSHHKEPIWPFNHVNNSLS